MSIHSPLARDRFPGGFTLLELLVVVGIISVIIALLMPALVKAREQANAVACASNIRQIGLAMIMYANDNQGYLPGAVWGGGGTKSPSAYTATICAAGLFNWGPYGTVVGLDNFNPQRHGGPYAAGMLVYYGYIKDLKVLYCPARSSSSEFSAATNLDPTKTNLSATDYHWNPGWNGGTDNWGFWASGGYLVATSDTTTDKGQNYMNCALDHKLGRAPNELPLVMDVCVWMGNQWGMEGWRQMSQGKGYNICSFDGSTAYYPDPDDIMERYFSLPGGGSGFSPTDPGKPTCKFSGGYPPMQYVGTDVWPNLRGNYLNYYYNPPTIGYDGVHGPAANGIAYIMHNWMHVGDATIQRAVAY